MHLKAGVIDCDWKPLSVIIIEPGIIETEFGDMMSCSMMDRSRYTAYAEFAKSVSKVTKEYYEKKAVTPLLM